MQILPKKQRLDKLQGKKMGKGGESLNPIPNVSPTRTLQ